MKVAGEGILKEAVDHIKKMFLTKVKGFDLQKICACTVVYEGSQEEVNY